MGRYDDLSRIERQYGSVAEYNRSMEEQDMRKYRRPAAQELQDMIERDAKVILEAGDADTMEEAMFLARLSIKDSLDVSRDF